MTRRCTLIDVSASVVVFDLDDTLYLERDFAHSGFKAVGAHLRGCVDAVEFAQICCHRLEQGKRGNVFDIALRSLGIEPKPALIDELVAVYRSHSPAIGLCPDAERFLDRLDEHQIGLISDGPAATQSAKVNALGLNSRIDHICLTGSLPEGHSKPHPLAFETIQNCTGLSGADHVYIADNGAKDFVAPNQLGWQTIQVLRPERIHDGTPPTPAHAARAVVQSLDEIELSAPTSPG